MRVQPGGYELPRGASRWRCHTITFKHPGGRPSMWLSSATSCSINVVSCTQTTRRQFSTSRHCSTASISWQVKIHTRTQSEVACSHQEEMSSMLPQVWIMALLHFQAGLSLYVIPERASQELERHPSPRLLPPFKMNTLNGCGQAGPHASNSPKSKPLGSHMVGWKYPVDLDTLIMIEFTIGGRVHQKSSAKQVTHPSTVPGLGSLILEFPWDPGEGLRFKPPFPLSSMWNVLVLIDWEILWLIAWVVIVFAVRDCYVSFSIIELLQLKGWTAGIRLSNWNILQKMYSPQRDYPVW